MSKLIYPFSVLRVFFSLRCNFNCGYCSMMNQKELWQGDKFASEEVDVETWIKAFKRLEPTRDLVITPCNAEPAIVKDCHRIVNEGMADFNTSFYINCSDLSMVEIKKMTPRKNLQFYVSYHTNQIKLKEFIKNAKWLQENHNVVNFHAPMYPPFKDKILREAKEMAREGVILDTTHEYLGMYDGEMHYSYLSGGDWIENRLAHKLKGTPKRKVLCKTSFNHSDFYSRTYTVAPNGDIYTCWRHLYNKNEKHVIGNFFDEKFQFEDKYYECEDYGDCNICAWHKNIKDAETGEQLDRDVKTGTKTVSACIISGNEEDIITDCILSIVDWVDEIVFVDTGITDKTLEMAKQCGGDKLKVFKYKWCDDFSAARNFSISKAKKEWVFIIDTDERVIPGNGENLMKMLPSIEHDIIAVDVLNYYMDKIKGERVPRSRLASLRFFRKDYNPKYARAVHNQPLVRKETVVYRLPFTINHLGYDLSPEKMKEKYERRIDMCKKWTERNPDDIEAWYQYVRALKSKDGKFNEEAKQEMFDSLSKGLAIGNGHNDTQNVYIQMLCLSGWIHHIDKQHEKAVEFGKRALNYKPDYLDAILLVGMCYTFGISYSDGEIWLKKYLEEQASYDFAGKLDSIAMEHCNSRALVYKTLAQIEELKEVKLLNV